MKPTRTTRATVIVALGCVTLAACSSKHNPTAGYQAAPNGSSPPSGPAPMSPSTPPGPTRPTTPATAPATATPTLSPAATTQGSVPAGFTPASVTFVSPERGFVLGVLPCAAGSCTTLVATADAGKTWNVVGQLHPALAGDEAAVSTVRFATPLDGWVFGPQLWSTHDGGTTWRQIHEPQPVSDVEAAAGVAYALVGGQLLRTPVGSDVWQEVRQVGASATMALHGHAIWVVGHQPDLTQLFTSADGASWQTLSDPCAKFGEAWMLSAVAPVTTSHVFLLCAGGAGGGSESKRVLVSADAGRTATATAADPPRGGIASGIAAASASVVAVVASSGASEVYRSGDAGKTWQTPLQEGDGGFGYYDVGFTTATQGVAIYGRPGQPSAPQPELLMTRDAGATWSVVHF